MRKSARSKEEIYAVMAQAIAYIAAHIDERPSVATVARAVGMSESRFAHAFSAWVGTTPKRFVTYLTKERIKKLLLNSKDILAATHRSGFSGPGRVHDLMVTYEAVSPGEFRHTSIDIMYGVHQSPFGWCVIGVTKRGICYIAFAQTDDPKAAARGIQKEWPTGKLALAPTKTAPYIKKIFHPTNKSAFLPILVKGTNFQIKVWEALLRIPKGSVITYTQLAQSVHAPRAIRAAASACSKNPIAYLIPCHRVLASNGVLGGYHWGARRKQALLLWESTHIQ